MSKQPKQESPPRFAQFQRPSDPALKAVQFKPGAEYGRLLERWALRHVLKRGEAAKRLGIMAISGYDIDRAYPLLAELASLYGRREAFAITCRDMNGVINDQETSRGEPLSRDEVTDLIKDVLTAVKQAQQTNIPADTEVGALTSKD